MVLQGDRAVPVWGHCNPRARVVVSFGGQHVTTQADDRGAWRADLEPMPASKEGRELVVESEEGCQGRT